MHGKASRAGVVQGSINIDWSDSLSWDGGEEKTTFWRSEKEGENLWSYLEFSSLKVFKSVAR